MTMSDNRVATAIVRAFRPLLLLRGAAMALICGAIAGGTAVQAAWIDDFDDGAPLTNSTSIGWTKNFESSTNYPGYSYPFVAEPGRDGVGSIELASAGGVEILNTTAPVPELDFFSAPTRLTFQHVNNQKYQAGVLQGGVGGFSLVYSNLFLGSTPGRSGGGAAMNDLITIDLLGLAKQIRLARRLNGAQVTLGTISNLVDDPGNPTVTGDVVVSNMSTYVLDLDSTNVTLTVIDEVTGLKNTLMAAHGFTLADWNAGSGGAYIGMASDSQLNQTPPAGPRASTLSVGRIIAGIPEPTAACLATFGWSAAVALSRSRRRVAF
jgi:hypothetical protein